jgi:hypothetical protein
MNFRGLYEYARLRFSCDEGAMTLRAFSEDNLRHSVRHLSRQEALPNKKFRRLLDGTFLFEKTGCLLDVLESRARSTHKIATFNVLTAVTSLPHLRG